MIISWFRRSFRYIVTLLLDDFPTNDKQVWSLLVQSEIDGSMADRFIKTLVAQRRSSFLSPRRPDVTFSSAVENYYVPQFPPDPADAPTPRAYPVGM